MASTANLFKKFIAILSRSIQARQYKLQHWSQIVRSILYLYSKINLISLTNLKFKIIIHSLSCLFLFFRPNLRTLKSISRSGEVYANKNRVYSQLIDGCFDLAKVKWFERQQSKIFRVRLWLEHHRPLAGWLQSLETLEETLRRSSSTAETEKAWNLH